MSDTFAVRLQRVTKTFGDTAAVRDLDLEIPTGSVYGFIGPNGSGKTTTIRMILRIFQPDSGTIEVLGTDRGDCADSRVGYLPEERGLYRRMKVRELLRAHPSARRHELIVHLMPADLSIRMNGTDLIQVLLNLITNAFQASPTPIRVEVSSDYLSEPLTAEQREQIGWVGREGVNDAGYQFHYYRMTDEGSILWGGWDTLYHYRSRIAIELENNPQVYADLAAQFLETFPQLEGIKFTHAWSGAIDTCSRFSAFWGTAMKGRVAYVLGYTGLGVAATRFGAATMLDILDGLSTERTALKMVQRKPVPFPPEPLRYAIIAATTKSIARAETNGRRNAWLRTLDAFGVGFDS